MLADLLYHITDFVFPSRCVNCNSSISFKENCLCSDCLDRLTTLRLENACERCSGIIADNGCTICVDRQFYIDKNITIAGYDELMKNILHNYKFNNKKRLCYHLSELGCNRIKESGLEFDIITSVPTSRKKKYERGYNQSELIARGIAKKLGIKHMPLLKENSDSLTQKKLHYKDRFINILGRYTSGNADIRDKRIMLIDDVFTTGATINECARILKSFKAKNVYSLTMARVVIKRLEIV